MCEKENLKPMQIGAKEITYKTKRMQVLANEASTKNFQRKLANASKIYFSLVQRYRQVV